MESCPVMLPDCTSEEQWSVYQRVIADFRASGIPFAVGGGLAVGVYTGLWRDTKDIDLYVLRKDVDCAKEILNRAGLVDYYSRLPYDRAWIYRSVHDKTIVDVIFSMANHKADVDETWIMGGPEVTIRGETFRIVPPEEMIWAKLYVLQKDRCDWPDVFNMIYAQHEQLDWGHLVARLGSDAALLRSVLTVFGWLCPKLTRRLPRWLWEETENPATETSLRPADLLDRRNWFIPAAEC